MIDRAQAVTCPFCRGELLAGERWWRCGGCKTTHHWECHALHGACAVFGCRKDETVTDEWSINPDDPVPIGEQIAYRVLYAIARGVYLPGDKLPTVRETAVRLKVNPNTVSKAFRDLERDGILVSRRGSGVFVREGAREAARARRQSLVLERFERAVGEALDAGLDAEEIQEVLVEALERAAHLRRDEDVVEAFVHRPWTAYRKGRRSAARKKGGA
ncbi:MAG: GntR family transcriptional regulator [Planctomycetota bacterium]